MFIAPTTEDITFVSAEAVDTASSPAAYFSKPTYYNKSGYKKLLKISFASNQDLVELNDQGMTDVQMILCGRMEDDSHMTSREIWGDMFWNNLEIEGWDGHQTINSGLYKELKSRYNKPPFIYSTYIPVKQASRRSGDGSEDGYRFLPGYDLRMYPEALCLQLQTAVYIATSQSNIITIDKKTLVKALSNLKMGDY